MSKRRSPLVRRIEQIRADPVGVCKHVRRALGLSQEALAKLCDVSYVTVNRWERGPRKPTHAHAVLVLVRLARRTGYEPPKPEPEPDPQEPQAPALSPIPRERRRQLAEQGLTNGN